MKNRIKELRLMLNLSQKDLADMVSVNKQSLSNWETEKQIPSVRYAILLARSLCTDIETLFNSDEV